MQFKLETQDPQMSGEGSQRLLKTDRILKREEFLRVYEEGRKVHARYFTAFILPNDVDKPRLGITVTRKTGNSVERNRARRLVREAFRKTRWIAPIGVDIVINAKRLLVDAKSREVEREFVAFWERMLGQ
jgi:ribonuclease P protein component